MTALIDRGLPIVRFAEPESVQADEPAVVAHQQPAELHRAGGRVRIVAFVECSQAEQTRVQFGVTAVADEALPADVGEGIVEVAPVEDHGSDTPTAEVPT